MKKLKLCVDWVNKTRLQKKKIIIIPDIILVKETSFTKTD